MSKSKYRAMKYIRLSYSEDRDSESNSVANQRSMLNTFLAQHPDIEDAGEKVDDGYSGARFDRPAFTELMEEIEAGHINCVIVKDLSRFGRDYIETGRYLRRIFPALGVRFIAINDQIDTAQGSAPDDITVSMKNIVNDTYSRDISIKTRSSLAIRREAGAYIGACAIYGYKKSEENKNQLVIDEYPANIVQEIFRLRIDGMSAAAIAEELNRRGVLSPLAYKKDRGLPHPKRGFADRPDAKWAAIAIIRILREETYTGTLVQGRCNTPNHKLRDLVQKPPEEWVRVENTHEAIIGKKDFALVQHLSLLDTRTAPGQKTAHLFSGLLICGCCGGRMTRKTVPYKGSPYYYYFCPTGKKHGCTAPVMLKESELVDCVLGSIRAQVANLASAAGVLQEAAGNREQSPPAKRMQQQMDELEKRLAHIAACKAGAHQYLISGVLSKEDHRQLKAQYAKEAKALSESLRAAKNELHALVSGSDSAFTLAENFQKFASLTELDRRTVASLIHSIRVEAKDKLHITFHYQPGFEEIQELHDCSDREKGVA